MLIIRQHRIYRTDLKANPHALYVFGDNLARVGMGGQAKEMRWESNACGIATKRRPTHGNMEDYFHDEDEDVMGILEDEFKQLHHKRRRYAVLILPSDGIGTGLARLSEFAPNALFYINRKIEELSDAD